MKFLRKMLIWRAIIFFTIYLSETYWDNSIKYYIIDQVKYKYIKTSVSSNDTLNSWEK